MKNQEKKIDQDNDHAQKKGPDRLYLWGIRIMFGLTILITLDIKTLTTRESIARIVMIILWLCMEIFYYLQTKKNIPLSKTTKHHLQFALENCYLDLPINVARDARESIVKTIISSSYYTMNENEEGYDLKIYLAGNEGYIEDCLFNSRENIVIMFISLTYTKSSSTLDIFIKYHECDSKENQELKKTIDL